VQTDSTGKKENYSIFRNAALGGPASGKEGSLNFTIAQVLMAKLLKRSDSAAKTTNVNIIDNLNIRGGYNFLADSFQLSDLQLSLNTRLLNKVGIQWTVTRRPLRFNQFRLSLNTGLNPDVLKGKKTPAQAARRDRYTEGEWGDIQTRQGDFYDFNIPWNLSLNYNYSLNKTGLRPVISNVINLSGDLSLTPQWKIGYNTGYIINRKAFSFSQFTVTRDLHCWQISFQWIPDGIRKSWVFTLSPKAGILQDMKLNKRVLWNEIR
jgi:hypothetical protein